MVEAGRIQFSIITSCFNSSTFLRRTFESLVAQTNKNFEWVVVDDCSSDDGATVTLIKELADEAPFPVKTHFFPKNYHGARSVSKACELASGEFACILDHDDQLVPDALQTVAEYLRKYDVDGNLAGVRGRCEDAAGHLVGKEFRSDVQLATESEIRFGQRNTAELCNFARLELLENAFEGMKQGQAFGYGWARIPKECKSLYVNDVLRIYDTNVPTSVLNNQALWDRYPAAKFELLLLMLESYVEVLALNPVYSCKLAGMAVYYRLLSDSSIWSIESSHFRVKALLWACYPAALARLFLSRLKKQHCSAVAPT